MPELNVQTADGSRERFPLIKERVTIGRSRESDIFLPDQWLSRHHAEIRQKPDGHYVVDLGSKNGTLVNGEKLGKEQRLRPGDIITLGEHVLTFMPDEPADTDDDPEVYGTRVFSVKELSDVATKPVYDPDELARQNRVLGVLSRAASALVVHRSLPDLFELVLDLLFEAVPAERGAVLLIEGGPPNPVIKASRNRKGDKILKVSRSIARRVLDQKVSLLMPNIMEDAALKSQDSILSTGIRSALCAPLWFTSSTGEQDQVIGLVYLDSLQRAHSFTEDDLSIVTAIANVAAAKIENARLLEESMEKRRLEEDMRMAAEIQTSLLPKSAPRLAGYQLVGSNRPCRAVGGDYYDFGMDQGHVMMALGDVSGKGTGAALLMTVLRAAVRGHWMESAPAEAVVRINRTVCQNVPEGKYMTFFLARLHPESGHLTYVNAGHNPPLLIRADGRVEQLEEGGMVLGMFDSVPYADGSVDIAAGDTLLIFSDGVTETWSASGEEFGERGLTDIGIRARGLDAESLQSEILRQLDFFSGGAKATDDRTLIVLKRA